MEPAGHAASAPVDLSRSAAASVNPALNFNAVHNSGLSSAILPTGIAPNLTATLSSSLNANLNLGLNPGLSSGLNAALLPSLYGRTGLDGGYGGGVLGAVTSDATECRLVEYRGERVAAFLQRSGAGSGSGTAELLLCLPQAFELFLKHLVGGLHTVYTKLKRLGISPIVCNVEQVRILRGLGAIQPGVNRCKLLACRDFDALYRDCTTAR